MSKTLPPVLRSWHQLRDTGALEAAQAALPISPEGTTYTMAQALAWVDREHFAVGRWDGSMSIFKFSQSATQGSLITKAVNTPSAEGVQMVTWLAQNVIVTSNDQKSALVWQTANGQWSDLRVLQQLDYPAELGVANSGDAYTATDGRSIYFVMGHANGFVTIWQGTAAGTGFQLRQKVDVRSAHPVNPWNLHNVRGLSVIQWDSRYGYVVSGSEDGDLCVIRVPDGAILSRTVYNPAARGINNLSTYGQNLLVANCAVGAADKNLWYYVIDPSNWSVQLKSAVNLRINPSAAQVFNFDVSWGAYAGGLCWYSATEEGYLWMGTANAQGIGIIGNQKFTQPLGAAIGYATSGYLALAAYDVYEYNAFPRKGAPAAEAPKDGGQAAPPWHPERFALQD